MREVSLVAFVLVFAGCRKVEPAPLELDELLHYAWQNLASGSDEQLEQALVNLNEALDGDHLVDPSEGTVTTLSASEAALGGTTAYNPSLASGVYFAMPYTCDIHRLEEVVSHPHQDVMYPGVYKRFERAFPGSTRGDFLDGAVPTLDWTSNFDTGALGAEYEADLTTLVRRVPRPDGSHALFSRVVLDQPVVFDNPDSKNFIEQDYNLEIYWARGDDIVHVYAMWRHSQFLGFEDEQETTQRIVLNNMRDWDQNTADLCGLDDLPKAR